MTLSQDAQCLQLPSSPLDKLIRAAQAVLAIGVAQRGSFFCASATCILGYLLKGRAI
jgi:hypothetical protein